MTARAPAWELRLASEKDRNWLRELHRETLGEYVDAIWRWDDDDQRRRFDESFDPRREGKPLALGVLRSNPRPRRLHEREGLTVVEELDTHLRMRSG